MKSVFIIEYTWLKNSHSKKEEQLQPVQSNGVDLFHHSILHDKEVIIE
jgi:hypothetical protein